MEIISNTAIIAVNQDRLGHPASRVWKKRQEGGGDLQLWAGPLADGLVPPSYQSICTYSHGYCIHEDQPWSLFLIPLPKEARSTFYCPMSSSAMYVHCIIPL